MSDTPDPSLTRPAAHPDLWRLDPSLHFLNHGSFGSCPKEVLAGQAALRELLERQPVQFLARELEGRLDEARATLADFLGAAPEDLVPVPNTTAGVNTVLRSLPFRAEDELVVTDHEYTACRNALEFVARQHGACFVVVRIPFPLSGPDVIRERILEAVTPRTRLVLVDHVTSQTALITPIAELVRELRERGVETLVDGSHAPGMLPLDLHALGAAFYTGNCHKWLCAPKGAAFLHVRRDVQDQVRPLSISHGASSRRKDRSRFLLEFSWTGTLDPTAFLSVPLALRVMGSLMPGGWTALQRRNHALAVAARNLLLTALGLQPPCPEFMLGSMASVPIPDSKSTEPPLSPLYSDPDQAGLLARHGIEVPIIPWPEAPHRLIRISCQAYNSLGQYEVLAAALAERFGAETQGG